MNGIPVVRVRSFGDSIADCRTKCKNWLISNTNCFDKIPFTPHFI